MGFGRLWTRCVVLVGVAGWVGCQPPPPPQKPAEPAPERDVSGSALVLDVSPSSRLKLVGDYAFDLLGAGVGKACTADTEDVRYWVVGQRLARLGPDRLTRQAIAAATLDAVSRLEDADTILVTSVVTHGKAGKVCAEVRGRGVRLTKRTPANGEPAGTKPAEKAPADSGDSDDSPPRVP